MSNFLKAEASINWIMDWIHRKFRENVSLVRFLVGWRENHVQHLVNEVVRIFDANTVGPRYGH